MKACHFTNFTLLFTIYYSLLINYYLGSALHATNEKKEETANENEIIQLDEDINEMDPGNPYFICFYKGLPYTIEKFKKLERNGICSRKYQNSMMKISSIKLIRNNVNDDMNIFF